MSAFVLSKIFPSMNIDASQRFIFGLEGSPEPLGSFKLDNIFVPILGSPSFTNFEMRNESLSGYRWIHKTQSTETYGSFKLQKFLAASPTGIDVISFNDDGSFVFPGTTDAKYILQTANANLPNAQSLGALTTGIIKNTSTTGTGVLSITTPGVDYYAPHKPTTLIDDFNLNGDINDSYSNLGVGEFVFNALTLNDPDNTYNAAFGAGALYPFTAGNDNTAIGQYSMFSFETGSDNTALGSSCAVTFVSGDLNVFVGKGACYNLSGGRRNTVVGTDALVSPTGLVDDNTVIGYNAASTQLLYTGCVFIGKNADASANNLTNAIAIGHGALVGASNCMVLGQNVNIGIRINTPLYPLDVVGVAGISINVNSNRIIGVATPVSGTDAANKAYVDASGISIGDAKFIIQTADADLPNAQILGSLSTGIVKNTTTTGVLSIATAGTDYYSPLNPATLTCDAGTHNASFSRNAYSSLTSGTGNAIFNVFGGQVLTSGTGNVIFAGIAGQSLTTGSSNILIGNSAGGPISTGNSSIIIGTSAGDSLSTPDFNIIIGSDAGHALQTGHRNVIMGAAAGSWSGGGFATYDHCIFLGYQAIPNTSNLTNAVAIGYGASVTTSNSMVLGSALNVGVNESSPTYARLCLVGGVQNITSEESALRVSSGTNAVKIELNSSSGSGKLYELRSNNDGSFSIFDRTSVVSRLSIDINGISTFTKNVLISTASSSDVPLYQVGHSTDIVQLGYDGANDYSFINIDGSSNDRLAFRVSGTGIAAFLSSGLFGFGTISPTQAKVVVSGGVQNVTSEDSVIRAISSSNAAKIEIQQTGGSGKLYELRSDNAGAFSVFDRTGAASRLFINTSGNVGIGTTPNALLQLSNATASRKFVIYEAANNDHQVKGLGHDFGVFRFQTNTTTDDYVFYAGTSSSASNEVGRLKGIGDFLIPGTFYGRRPSGTCYMQANATATAVTATTWTKVAGTTSSGSLNKFTMPANNKLLYSGTPTVIATIVASVTASHDVVLGATLGFSFFKNGVQVVPSAMFNQDPLSTTRNTSIITIVSLATNDYIEVYCQSSATGNITVSYLTVDISTT